jgi:hypothetical protein
VASVTIGGADGGKTIVDSVVERERASATPVARHKRLAHAASPAHANIGTALPDRSLCSLETWFARAVMTPESEAEPTGSGHAERLLTRGPQLAPLERLEVYRRAYHARLIECLLDDYPALAHALGEDAFDALCRAYIARHPSTGPNLNSFGRSMVEFCLSEANGLDVLRGFAADLAALEWAMVEVIHAPTAEPLTLAGLAEVPVERWADAQLVATTAFRLLQFDYPVNVYFQAFRDGKTPTIPAPARSAAAVYRSGPTLWRMDLTEPACALLQAIASGQTLGTSLEEAAAALSGVSEEDAAGRVMSWFRDWVASGLFARVEFSSAVSGRQVGIGDASAD